MRKKVIFGAVAALFLGAGIFTSVNLTEKHQMSDLTLANIEAMTFDLDMGDLQGNCEAPWDNICVRALGESIPGVLTVKGY